MSARPERTEPAPINIAWPVDYSPCPRAPKKKEGKTKMRETIKLRFDGQILSKKNRHMVARIGGHSFIKPDQEAKANEDNMVNQFKA